MAQPLYPKYQPNRRRRWATEGWYGCSGEKKNVIQLPKLKPWFLCHFAHSSVTYSSQLSQLPLTSPNTQHSPSCTANSCSVSQGRSHGTRRFLLCPPTLQLVHTASQNNPFNITSPLQVSYVQFYGPKYFYTFVNSTMPASNLPHHSIPDFVSLTLIGKQCTLLCPSGHFQRRQNVKKSVNTQTLPTCLLSLVQKFL
jgi:hypothetical protein